MHVQLVKNVFNHEISIFFIINIIYWNLKLRSQIVGKLVSLSVFNKVDVKITFKFKY